MISFIVAVGLMNMIAGQLDKIPHARLIFRCIAPSVLAGCFAIEKGFPALDGMAVMILIGIGSALWFIPNWSFDEINGTFSEDKYPAIVRRLALAIFPCSTNTESQNRKRGILLKSIRGLYDILTFAGLTFVNIHAIAFLPGTLLMGPVYWASGRIERLQPVLYAELAYGCVRGALIAYAITWRMTA